VVAVSPGEATRPTAATAATAAAAEATRPAEVGAAAAEATRSPGARRITVTPTAAAETAIATGLSVRARAANSATSASADRAHESLAPAAPAAIGAAGAVEPIAARRGSDGDSRCAIGAAAIGPHAEPTAA